ncbi:hypothetical protein L0337_19270 [candidate division KSB1 bacterium]|nr:hypothetical protein [candidate division KSB1 bacterium]
MLPADGKPKASHDFALELQAGLSRINFPTLWITADPGVVVSMVNPIGMKRLEDLQRRLPRLEVREFGEGYHFLTEENPAKVAQMASEWINELR